VARSGLEVEEGDSREMVKMLSLSPPHPMAQMTSMFFRNLVASTAR